MRRVSVVLIAAFVLSSCSHKPLKAPCDLNEGKPAAVVGAMLASLLPESLLAMMAETSPCGPLRRLGQD